MKYNVGDRVVKESNLTMLFNPFWKDEKRAGLICTVTEANENAFTVYSDKGRYETTLQNAFSCGMNNYLAYSQKTGRCWANRERFLHLEYDIEEICTIMETDGKTSLDKSLENHKKEIERHKYWIERERSTYDEDLRINRELLGLTSNA